MKTMAIHAQAVEILVRKSRFEPEVAMGVAEAIEVSINLAQLVTVPILDSRLQDLRHELKADIQSLRLEFKTDLSDVKRTLASEIAEVRGTIASEIAQVNANVASEIAKVNASIAQTNTTLAEGLGRLSTEIQKANANQMRWVLLTLMGSLAVSMAAKSLLSVLSN